VNRPVHGGSLAWAAQWAGCSPEDILDFSASISPLGPPPSVLEAIQANIPRLVHYPEPNYDVLRQQLARYHAIPPDWIFPGNGAAELLTWASREFSLLAGGYLLVPAFGDYIRALNSFGVLLRKVSLLTATAESDWDQILTQQPPQPPSDQPYGILLNNPHNPTGILFKCDWVKICLERFALVVVDEAFMDFVPPSQQQSVLAWVEQYPNLVVLRSQTKFFSIPGLRFGYAISHPDRFKRWQQWRDPWPVNTLAAAAAIAAVQDHAFHQATWDWLLPARQWLYEALARLPGLHPWPGQANFLLVQCDTSVSLLQQALLRQHQIYIRDCLSFAELGNRYFRVAIKTQAENERLIAALKAVL
jgi:L-threonine-O-3-phosphate decarboxylase